MSVLRFYSKDEWNPKDWDLCQTCRNGLPPDPDDPNQGPCPKCQDHGSLHAAALDHLRNDDQESTKPENWLVRCETCHHPYNKGTWEGQSYPFEWAYQSLEIGIEPSVNRDEGIHYTCCDEKCRHPGPATFAPSEYAGRRKLWEDGQGMSVVECVAEGANVESSWRAVDVRRLSWDSDIRPQYLALLCLRCWANRTKETP